MVAFSQSPVSRDPHALLSQLQELTGLGRGLEITLLDEFTVAGRCYEIPRLHPRPFDLIFETPARASFVSQTLAGVAALDAILAEYLAFIVHAHGI